MIELVYPTPLALTPHQKYSSYPLHPIYDNMDLQEK